MSDVAQEIRRVQITADPYMHGRLGQILSEPDGWNAVILLFPTPEDPNQAPMLFDRSEFVELGGGGAGV
jgi:hypothetical protein